MGQLFENFEKVDIKVERKNTEEARKQAEQAEKRAEAAEKKVEEEHQKVEKERKKAMQSYVSLCKELGGAKETAVRKLIETFEVSREEAEKKTDMFWKG